MLNSELNLIYWADSGTGKIQRAKFDGSYEDLFTGLEGPTGIALAWDNIYWTEWDKTKLPQRGTIKWANLDNGSSPKDLPITQLVNPTKLALDVSGNRIYWADTPGGPIQRAMLDGSPPENLPIESPGGIALDVLRNKIYWTNPFKGKIQCANLDEFNGSPPEDLVTGLKSPNGIAIDTSNNMICWTDMGGKENNAIIPGKIQCANLDEFQGRALDTSQIKALIIPSGRPVDIALDVPRGKIYWTTQGMGPTQETGAIQRADLDGYLPEDFVTGLKSPSGIDLYA